MDRNPAPAREIPTDTSSANARIRLQDLLIPGSGLGLAALFVHQYRLEDGLSLPTWMPVVFIGFLVHSVLPLVLRPTFQILITVAASILILGWMGAGLVLGLTFLLFLILDSEWPRIWKWSLFTALALFLTVSRAGWLPFPDAGKVLPIVGTMFLFRGILFVQAKAKLTGKISGIRRWSYFYLLPNLGIPIFPVVDFHLYSGQYYNRPAVQIYNQSVRRIFNGLIHLFAYRLIYFYCLPSPYDVHDIASLALYNISTYLLAVRLAGFFHLSVGVIGLFGYDLPQVFHHYFFASGFSDIWRRINIYWRDFITKVFYHPIYFRLKSLGSARAIILSILIVFVINWFLHGLQWFWIRGSYLISWQDILFWGIFGIGVAISTWLQIKNKGKSTTFRTGTMRDKLRHALKVLAMFLTISVLWTFWTSPSFPEWLMVMGKAGQGGLDSWVKVLGGILLLFVGGFILGIIHDRHFYNPGTRDRAYQISQHTGMAVLTALILIGSSGVKSRIEDRLGVDMSPVLRTKLNAYDREQQFKGYYETLLVRSTLNSPLMDLEDEKNARKDDFGLGFTGAGIWRNDLILKDLKPNYRARFKGGEITIDSLGLRDLEYPAHPGPCTFRMALLGGSIEMGVGVDTRETYENLAESRMNAEHLFGPSVRTEILNYGISGNHLFQSVAVADLKTPDHQPQILIYPAHANESHRALTSIFKAVATGRDLLYPELTELMAQAGIAAGTTEAEFMDRLNPRSSEIVRMGYQKLAEIARSRGEDVIWMYVPTLDDNVLPGEQQELEQMARSMGFHILSLADAYRGKDPQSLTVAPWDTHPNKAGHELLAREWIRQWRLHPELIGLPKAYPSLRDCH